MPELTGIELAKFASSINSSLKIIFVTGHVTQLISETINGIPEGKKRVESKFGETIISSFNYLKSHKFGYSFLHAFKKHDYYDGNKNKNSESKITQTEPETKV